MLLLDGQVHHDTHVIPMGNYVIGVGNYVIVTSSNVGNYVSADNQAIALVIRVIGFVAESLRPSLGSSRVSGYHLVPVIVLPRGWPPGDVWLAV